MSVYVDPSSGAISYLFNGAALPCQVDTDCPGAAVCSVNPPNWKSAIPSGMCICPLIVPSQGPNCESLTSAGVAYTACFISAAIMGGLACLVGCLLLYKSCTVGKGKEMRINAMTLAVCFITAGSACLAIMSSFFTASSLSPVFQATTPAGKKISAVLDFTEVVLVLTVFFCTLGMLQISVAWIEVATAANQLRKLGARSFKWYRYALYVYYVVLLVAMFVCIFSQNWALLSIVAIPAMLFVVVTYLVGYFKLRSVLTASAINSPPTASGGSQVLATLSRIQTTSLAVAILVAILVTSLITFAAVGAWATGLNPITQPASVATAFIWNTCGVLIIVMMRYFVVSMAPKLLSPTQRQLTKPTPLSDIFPTSSAGGVAKQFIGSQSGDSASQVVASSGTA